VWIKIRLIKKGTMPIEFNMTTDDVSKLRCALDMKMSVDWRAISLDDLTLLASLVLHDLASERMGLIRLLKAYQRLVRILPSGEERRALPLLESGLHSAIQIAGIPRDEFARRWAALFPGEDALGLAVHRAALSRRGELLLQHINNVQRNEPHYRAARFK
jgi:hypothetical protein